MRQIEHELGALLPYTEMKGITEMARLLANAIAAGKRLLIIADYDFRRRHGLRGGNARITRFRCDGGLHRPQPL